MILNDNNQAAKASTVNECDEYFLDDYSRFQIKNYDKKPAFASFLPGIGGLNGVPLWCLYVNRGQAVSSFGTGNKDNAIIEFLPANWAYQLTSIQGFRTFCKIKGQYYEPFQNDALSEQYKLQRTMWIEMDRLKIQEENYTLGLSFEITYFSPVNKPIGSLARMVTITNISSQQCDLNCLDGLPLIIPAGFTDVGIKTMRHIYEAYCSVRIVAGHVPFYAAKVAAHDEAEVEEVRKGNFYASWLVEGGSLSLIEPYYDSDLIFGSDQNLVTPREFIEQKVLDRAKQIPENKLPCSMSSYNTTLGTDESVTLIAMAGTAPNESMLKSFLSKFETLSYFEQMSEQSHQLMNAVTQPAFFASSKPHLDAYTRQNYLDNVLRGGIPKLMPSKGSPKLLYLYSRRHGDAERDYNFFDLPPSPLSCGEGNYRDICQNRRNNIWFYPELFDAEIRMFVSLLQADGYNPLSVKGYQWRLCKQADPMQLCPSTEPDARAAFKELVNKCFSPGELLSWADYHNVDISERIQWLETLLSQCEVELVASGHEGGYWIDHWTYILDLLEAFNAVYPDQTEAILTQCGDVEWFVEPANVVERAKKYVRRKNRHLQLSAVIDAQKPSTPLPPTTIFGKLCAVLAIKAVSLDYEGRGIEMEAGRPGWNDSMNGLPGLFGSSTCEAVETLRLAKWLLGIFSEFPDTDLPIEVARLISNVCEDLQSEFDWDRSATIRETFRKRVYGNTSRETQRVSDQQIRILLEGIVARFERALDNSIDPETGLLHTYYLHKPIDSDDLNCQIGTAPNEPGRMDISLFEVEPLPLFLEGQVHWLRVCSQETARQIYNSVRNSPLLDKKLQMYKLNECLEQCSPDIGRARTFSRGWFENESIWLHMSTKYLLELVANGLYEEFYSDAKTMLVPFMDPKVYGRSILENSSFIAPSVCPDPQARGRGFIARLSGTTAEFIHIWLLLTVGKQPFKMRDGQLCFSLQPALPAEWFTQKPRCVPWSEEEIEIPQNALACALSGQILLIYHNPSMQNTYGNGGVHPVKYVLNGDQVITGSGLTGTLAEQIRKRNVQRMDVWLG
jgi:hypothetical protein